ncbi:MAG: ribonuclease E inhibitor RraB [Planctomycetaceae bacterium]
MSKEESDEQAEEIDAEVIRMLEEDGHDLSQPMDVDFHVAAGTEESAHLIAEAARDLGYTVFVDYDDGAQDEDDDDEEIDITEPWTCTCRREMLLTLDGVLDAQAELDELARPHGGYSDGWGTFGNAVVDDDLESELNDEVDEQ